MKTEFIQYLERIGLSEIIIDKIKDKYLRLVEITDIPEFDDIFVSETSQDDGDREYYNLSCFTPSMMASIALSGKDISFVKILDVISSLNVTEFDLDLTAPNGNSKFNCYVKRIHVERALVFNSSGINCSHLLKLCKKYFMTQINSRKI